MSEPANDECAQFLSPAFVNSLVGEFPDDNGFGAVMWISLHELIDVGMAVADADADWENIFDDTFAIFEVDFKPTINGRQGNYRLYGWLNNKEHVEIADPSKDKEDGQGFGLSLDQELTEALTLFGRFGTQRQSIYEVTQAWSFGFQISGSLFGRDDDCFGFAYGAAIFGKDWKEAGLLTGVRLNHEFFSEVYYRLTVNDNLAVSSHVQWVTNPAGDNSSKDVCVFGVRFQLCF